MTKNFRIPKGRAAIMLEYTPEDFGFCYFWTNTVTVRTGIVSLSGQFGPFYCFFGMTKTSE